MASGVTTQWEDIHVKLGNYVPRDHVTTGEELHEFNNELAEAYNPLNYKTNKELEELEEEFEDDEFLK